MSGGVQTLDAFVSSVQSNAGNPEKLGTEVRKASGGNGVLSRNKQHLDTVLQSLDCEQHSAAFVAILLHKFPPPEGQVDQLISLTFTLMQTGNPEQIRHVVELYYDLCHKLTLLLVSKGKHVSGIIVLSEAIDRLVTSSGQLTALHADLCLLCLKSKILRPALPYLDTDMKDIVRQGNMAFDSSYLLTYYYYGAMIYTAVKRFSRAILFFETAVCVPANAVSHIMVEAYKKLLLVSLIHGAKVDPLPRYVSSVVNRFIKPSCTAYADIVTSYALTSPQALIDDCNKHMVVFQRDSNWGLVQQVLASYYRSSILRLTKTFVTLSLGDVAHRCHLSGGALEAERLIMTMVNDGEIIARVDARVGMVTFEDMDHVHMHSIECELQKTLHSHRMVAELDTSTLLNPQFAARVSKQSPSSAAVLPDDEGVSLNSVF